MNNIHAGIIISVVTVLVALNGWSYWYLLPLGYALSFTTYPSNTHLFTKKLELEISLLEKKLRKRGE
jgi:hypothetical protein